MSRQRVAAAPAGNLLNFASSHLSSPGNGDWGRPGNCGKTLYIEELFNCDINDNDVQGGRRPLCRDQGIV